jgi:hypothetical protein
VVKPYLLADIGEGKSAQWRRSGQQANVVARYHRVSSHPMVREAWRPRRTVRPDMRSTVRQGVGGGTDTMKARETLG